jgi:DNA polymerase III sliding clamp (beta) subunit (PCNA family)
MKTVKFGAKELVTTLTILNKMDPEFFLESHLALFKIRNGIAIIYGSNGRTEVEVKFYVDGDDCDIAVDKREMLDAVKGVNKGSGSITLEVGEGSMIIRGNTGTFTLELLEEYIDINPLVPSDVYLEHFLTKDLARALDSVISASPRKDTHSSRAVIHIVNGRVMYGCDNHRLARYEMKESYITFPDHVCIPTSGAKFIVDTLNILGDEAGKIGIMDGVMVVEIGKLSIGIKCEECALPAFESILAKEYGIVIFVNPRVFTDVLKQGRKIKKVKCVQLEVDPSMADKMKLDFRDEGGNSKLLTEVPIKLDKTGRFSKAFNVQYLIDALKPTRSEAVALCCPSEDNKSIEILDERYRAMIMETILG